MAFQALIAESLPLFNNGNRISRFDLRCVGFIRIDVHLKGKALVHADLDMIEDSAALIVSLHGNNISVLHSGSFGVLRGHMDMGLPAPLPRCP